MGRSPCCEKVGLKKGPWTTEEDQKLLAYIELHGHGSWRALPAKAGLQRCGKSCRLRWTNYLRPDIKRGMFSLQEEQTIIQLHALLGNRWSVIATHLPKRTDNEIKNHWNTHLKKRLTKMGIDPVTHKPKSDALGPTQSKEAAHLSHMAQWESARLQAEARLGRDSTKLQLPNPIQHIQTQLSFFASAQLLNKTATLPPLPPPPPPPPPPQSLCLDVLAAWQGAWPKTPISCGTVPATAIATATATTTTTTFSESSLGEIEDYNNISSACHGMVMNSNTTLLPSFTEGMTNILLESVDGSGDADLVGGSCGGDFEEHKINYWDSLLSLVNCSPFGSPVF